MNRKIVADMNRKTIAVILLAINSLAVRTEAAISTSPSRAAEFDPVAFIEDALARGEKTVVLPKGRYWLVPKEGRVSYMTFAGLDGVTVDFGGSEFVGMVRTRMLTALACTNCVFKNLVIDYDELPFTQAVITEVDADKNWTVEVLEGYPLPHKGNYEWPLQAYDAKTGELVNPMRFRDGIRIKPVSNRVYRVTGGKNRRGSVGDIAVWSVKERPGIPVEKGSQHAQGCVRCTFDSIVVYSTPHGCAFRDYFGDGETYVRCKVIRRPPETDLRPRAMKRLRSGNHDAFMMRGNVTGPKIIDCEAKYHCDDCVNIGGMFGVVTKVDGNRARVLFNYLGPSIDAGDMCEATDGRHRRLPDMHATSLGPVVDSTPEDIATLKSCTKLWPSLAESCKTAQDITFERPLEVGSYVISKRHQGWGFLVKGCDFGHNRARGMILSTTGMVVSNRCEATCGPAVKEAGPSFLWMEGGFSENIVYIDNDFPEHWLQKSDKP